MEEPVGPKYILYGHLDPLGGGGNTRERNCSLASLLNKVVSQNKGTPI